MKSDMVRWEHHMLSPFAGTNYWLHSLALTVLSTSPKSLFCCDLSKQICCPLSVPGNGTLQAQVPSAGLQTWRKRERKKEKKREA